MKLKGKKFILLLLIFSLVTLPGNLMAKERKGANLLVTKKDGQQIAGELITVKPNSLLLKNTEGRDETVDIGDINRIKIVKPSKVAAYGGGLFLLGAITRGALHSTLRKEERGEEATQHFVQASMGIGAACGAVGVIIGIVAGMDKTIKLEGKSDTERDRALQKLSKKARVPDYQ